jgi:hypothetical protein
MTRVAPVAADDDVDELGADELDDEQAAIPAASKPAVATATSRLWFGNLLIICVVFPLG